MLCRAVCINKCIFCNDVYTFNVLSKQQIKFEDPKMFKKIKIYNNFYLLNVFHEKGMFFLFFPFTISNFLIY